MEVPFTRFLTRFPVDDDLVADIESDSPLDEALDAQEIESARLAQVQLAEARQEVETRYLAEIAQLKAVHEAAVAAIVAGARTQWCDTEGTTLAQHLDAVIPKLRTFLDERIADVLAPLLGQAVIARTRAVLIESLDLVLADPKHPILTLKGPCDLLDAIRAARPGAVGIEYIAHDDIDAILNGDGLRIETRLEAAIATLTNVEA